MFMIINAYEMLIIGIVIGYIAAIIYLYIFEVRKVKREKSSTELINAILKMSIMALNKKIEEMEGSEK